MKKLLAIMSAAILLLSLSACGSSNVPESASPGSASPDTEPPASETGYSGQTYTLQLGHVGAEGSIEETVAERFADLVSEKSGGKIQVTIYGNSQMGGLSDLVDAVRYNTIDFAIFAMGNAESYFPKATIMGLPYLFKDYAQVESFYESDTYADLCDDFASETNIRELGSFHTGFRDILSNVKIENADDMKGLAIRVPEAPMFVKTFGALGCNTVTLSAADVYQALKTGLVEATEAAPSYMVSMNYHEVAKYCILTNHIYTGNSIFAPQDKLDQMDPAAVEIIKAAAEQATHEAWSIVSDETDKALSTMEDAGVEMVTPDLESFKGIMTDIWAELFTDSVDGGKDLIDAVLACA
ncbi:MAG: TRAP transporter substrate-binding protein DctP [Oscillospiraceae bacterium]